MENKSKESKLDENGNNKKQYTVKILQNINEIEKIRSLWENLEWHPHSTIDFFLTILRERSSILYPCIFLLLSNNIIEGLLVAKVEKKEIRIGIRNKIFWKPEVRSLTVLNGGILGKCTHLGYEALFDNLIMKLKQKEVDVVLFYILEKGSYFLHLAREKPKIYCREHFITYNRHWRIDLPITCGMFLDRLSRHRRHEIRRYPRLLEKQFPGLVEYKCHTGLESLDNICEELELIASKTYQRVLGEGFINNSEHRARLKLSAEKGWLRIYILYVEKKPWAFWIGIKYGNLFYLDFTGYEPAHKKFMPGTILFYKMIEDLINIKVREIDFGLGDAEYKHTFGNRYWDECSFFIFAPKGKTILINLFRSCTIFLSRIGNKIFNSLKMSEKRTKIWRLKLQNKARNKGN
jgi:hypothetical protein